MSSQRNGRSKTLFIISVALWFLFLSTGVSAQQYKVTALDPPQGYTASRAMGINNYGEVVGRFYNIDSETGDAVDRRAFIWDSTNGAFLLPSLSGETSAWAVNNNGFVSGFSYDSNGKQRAVLWDVDGGTVTDIGALRNSLSIAGDESTAYGLNDYQEVVGSADIPNDAGDFTPFHAFYYNPTDGIYDLGTLTTDWPTWANGYSIAYQINNHGQTVGIAHDANWNFLPFIDDKEKGRQSLPKDPNYSDGEWYAVVISDRGLIGGHVLTGENRSIPFYWPDESSAPVKITMPEGFPYGEIYGINRSGQMVGLMWNSDQPGAVERAFLFDRKTGVKDLNALLPDESGWELFFARDINNNGQIVGYGEKNGQKRGFLLNPAAGLAADFTAFGLYYFANGSISKLSKLESQGMQYGDGALYVNFRDAGLYRHSEGRWNKIGDNNPNHMVAVGSLLYADFGGTDTGGLGLYRYDGAWKRISRSAASGMWSAGNELYVNFQGLGLHRYSGGAWIKVSGRSAGAVVGVGADVYIDFGAGVGVYKYNGTKLTRISKSGSEGMCAGADVLYVDFASSGLYQYAGGAWTKLNGNSPEEMVVMGSDLYADFGGTGLYKYDGVWTKLTGSDASGMCAVGNDLYVNFQGIGLYQYAGEAWNRVSRINAKGMVAVPLN